MKKHKFIYKTWNQYTLDEQENMINDLRDDYPEYSEERLYELAADIINNDYYDDDFGKHGNVSFSSLKDQEVLITGKLGLWNGPHKIKPVKASNIVEAVSTCCGRDTEELEIYEDGYGNFILDAYHHDGCNHFIIKKLTDKGPRCLHFCREVYGA